MDTVPFLKGLFGFRDVYPDILERDLEANKLQRRTVRRWLVVGQFFATFSVCGFFYFVIEYSISQFSFGVGLIGWLVFSLWMGLNVWINAMFRVSVGYAFGGGGQSLDERQQQMKMNAYYNARHVAVALLAISVALSLLHLSMAAYLAVGAGLLIFTLNAPMMLLAWRLPDALNDEDEAQDAARG